MYVVRRETWKRLIEVARGFSSPVLQSAGILLAVAEKDHDYGDIIPVHLSEKHQVSSVGGITGFPVVVGRRVGRRWLT